MNIIAFLKMIPYFCKTLKAIHNKDYSVVKTFKAGPSGLAFFYSILQSSYKTGLNAYKIMQML